MSTFDEVIRRYWAMKGWITPLAKSEGFEVWLTDFNMPMKSGWLLTLRSVYHSASSFFPLGTSGAGCPPFWPGTTIPECCGNEGATGSLDMHSLPLQTVLCIQRSRTKPRGQLASGVLSTQQIQSAIYSFYPFKNW